MGAPHYARNHCRFRHQKKFDLLGMAQHGMLRMVPDMVDPVNRHIVPIQGNAQVAVYNNDKSLKTGNNRCRHSKICGLEVAGQHNSYG